MTLDTFLTIACLVGTIICWAGYRYFSENVYIRPKKYRIERYMK